MLRFRFSGPPQVTPQRERGQRTARAIRRLLRFPLAGLLGLPACNAILGIEPAELRQGTGGSASQSMGGMGGGTSVSTGGTSVMPVVTSVCRSCLNDHCSAQLAACMTDNACRWNLVAVTNCLAVDPSDSGCVEALGDDKLLPCISANCGVCGMSALASACELYCGCMKSECSAFLPAADCVATCGNLSAAQLNCRFTHCQVAVPPVVEKHCKHALASPANPCGDAPSDAPCTAGINPSGAPPGGGCNVAKDCCNNDCNTTNGFCN